MPGKILVADVPETQRRIDAHFADAKIFELLRAARAIERNRAMGIAEPRV